jgi:signal transduction histidine kinase/ActR/RegA family two-component response regulator
MRVWGHVPSEETRKQGVSRAALSGATRRQLMQEALQTVLSSGRADRAAIWMETAANDAPADVNALPDFHGIVIADHGDHTPAEWTRLSSEVPIVTELLQGQKTIEQDLDGSRDPLMISVLVGLRRALWTPVVSAGRVHGIILAGSRKKQMPLPTQLVESVAAELALACELEETRRFAQQYQQDIASVRRLLTVDSAQALGETLQNLVDSCTERQSGLAAVFAAIGRWQTPEDPATRAARNAPVPRTSATPQREMKFRWRSGDAGWTSSLHREPLRALWERAADSHSLVGGEPAGAHAKGQVAPIVAFPLEAGGQTLGVLVVGMRPGAAALPVIERLELKAAFAASVLLREQRLEELRQAATQSEALLHASDQAIALLDEAGNITALSHSARELLYEGCPALRPAQAAEEWLGDSLRAFDIGTSHIIYLPNNAPLHVRLDGIGPNAGALVVLDPPQDGAATQPRATRSEAELRSVLEWLEEGVLLFDARQNLRVMNSRFAQMAGLKPQEISSMKTFEELVARLSSQAADPMRFAHDWRDLARGIESGRREELELARPVPRVLERAACPVLDSRGVPLGRVEIYRDLTAQRIFQSKLLQTEKLASLGQMLTGIVHELSNPLTTILGYAQRLLLRSDDRGHALEARQIYEEAERASAILRQVLLSAHESRPERRTVALNEIVSRAMEFQRFGLATEKVRIELDLDPALPCIDGDAGQLQQVLMNLISNARQALESTSKGGNIIVRTKCIGDRRVLLQVQDNGPGIPQAILARIFDPFFTTKPAGIGTGLGLSIVLGIVREHGGQVHVTTPPAGGAKFSLEFPALPESQVAEIADRQKTKLEPVPRALPATETLEVARGGALLAPWAGARVLVVEDEPTVAQLIADVLEDEGLQVEALLDGREALRRAAAEPFDLVICDMKMPGLDGQHFYDSLARSAGARSKRFLFVTGDALAAHTREFLERNHLPLVAKPFRVEELTEQVRRVLAEAAPKKVYPRADTRTKVARK